MLNTKSDHYDNFICSAGACPESCCSGGWQIMIDGESRKLYSGLAAEVEAGAEAEVLADQAAGAKDTCALGRRLLHGVDWENEYFRQDGQGHCLMLDPDGLCSIQRALGEDALCDTCRIYPRHMEEFEDVREYSLSLSCPEAARMLLERKAPLTFIEWETEETDDPEEYEDFDFLLYSQLTDARRRIFHTVQDRSLSFREKALRIEAFAAAMQDCLDEGKMYELDELIYGSGEDLDSVECGIPEKLVPMSSRDSSIPEKPVPAGADPFDRNLFSKLFDLEFLKKDWPDVLDRTWREWKAEEQKAPASSCDGTMDPEDEIRAEQLLMFWIYTYFCGAVYDGWIYSKAMLAICSTYWIFRIGAANHFPGGLTEATYRYAREIEHSDENLNALEEWFMDRRRVLLNRKTGSWK